MNNGTDVVACLRHSIALIEKCGWMQGSMGNPVDGFCTLGAIGMASNGNRELFAATCQLVAKAIPTRQRQRGHGTGEYENVVAGFNDETGRKKEQIVQLLHAAVESVVNGQQRVNGICHCDHCRATNGYAKVTSVSEIEMKLTKEQVEATAEMMAKMPPLAEVSAMWFGGQEVPVPPQPQSLGSFQFPIIAPPKASKPKRKRKTKSKVPKPELADMLA